MGSGNEITLFAYSGRDTASPITAVAGATNDDSTGDIAAPAVTAVTADDMFVAYSAQNSVGDPGAGSPLTAITTTDTSNHYAAGYQNNVSAGSQGPYTLSFDTFVERYAVTVAIKSVSSTVEQEGFRFGTDDNSEAAHSWAAAQDANLTAPAGETRLLSFIINATGTPGAKTFKLQYRKVGDPSWSDMPIQ